MVRNFVVGPYYPIHPSIKADMYKLNRKYAKKFAESIGRELAEGPTLVILDNIYGPVELWPLVMQRVCWNAV